VTATLLVAAGVHTVDPDAPAGLRCVLIDGARIAWVGADPSQAPPAERTVHLGGAWITPAFVDAHVHATATGLALSGVDLTDAQGPDDVLDRLRRFAPSAGPVITGHGWDDFGWQPRRLPTAAEITAAAGGKVVLLNRVDAHSCLVDDSVLRRLPLERLYGVERGSDGAPTGWLREESCQAAQREVRALIPAGDLAAARLAACHAALALGIGSLHEMGHPGLSGLDDARIWASGEWPLEVHTWWAELDLDVAVSNGLRPGGDLFLDGSIGSCTAATSAPYGPDGGTGELFFDDDDVAAWFTACTAAGLGAGVHAIGDRAIEQALRALEVAAATHGPDAVRACRHRIEHVELITRGQVQRMAALGVVASMQPAFDAVWGGAHGLYAERFGRAAALESNPLGWLAAAGVRMAFGSDSTVTPLDPLGGVRAARTHQGGCSVDAATALEAATTGGHFVAGSPAVGRCAAGQRADLAVWSGDPLDQVTAGAVRCLATVVRGVVAHGHY
jgi:hypothetical protein